MGAATEIEQEGAVDEGRATERVLSLDASPDDAEWMGRFFLATGRCLGADGREQTWLRYWLTATEIGVVVAGSLESCIGVAQQRQRSRAGLCYDGGRVA